MRELLLVARHAFRQTVLRRGFLLGTLLVPLGLALLIALVVVVETSGRNRLPIGYLDPGSVLSGADPVPAGVRAYGEEAAAKAALERGEIQAYVVLPSSFPEDRAAELVYLQRPPDEGAWDAFQDHLRQRLAAALPEAVRARVLAGPEVVVEDVGSGRSFSETGVINIILPFVASMLFMLATMSAAGLMLRVVADEKENRTMELLLTSLSPRRLIGGKALGLIAAALLQLGIYLAAVVLGLVIGGYYVGELRLVVVPWRFLGITALFFVPAFALVSAIMIAVGAAVTDLQQGQQVGGLLNLLFLFPLFLLPLLIGNPGHPLFVALTLFPPTSLMAVLLRWSLGTVPLWQLSLSWLLLVGTTLLAVVAAARIFRAGMLRYGRPLGLRSLLAAGRG